MTDKHIVLIISILVILIGGGFVFADNFIESAKAEQLNEWIGAPMIFLGAFFIFLYCATVFDKKEPK